MWWKIIIVVALLVSVIIQIFRLRTSWCPHCKKRTGDRFYEEQEQDWDEDEARPFCSRCLMPKRN